MTHAAPELFAAEHHQQARARHEEAITERASVLRQRLYRGEKRGLDAAVNTHHNAQDLGLFELVFANNDRL